MYSIHNQKVGNKEFNVIHVKQQHIEVTFMDYGAAILEILVPNKDGLLENVVMNYQDLSSYVNNVMCLNAIIGPTSGRIRDAEFMIFEKQYHLDKNHLNKHNLHGGSECFAYRVFDFEIIDDDSTTKVVFTVTKELDGSSYPGTQDVRIIYTISDTKVGIEFIGTTSEDTLLNLTSHLYFNLSGNLKDDVLNHSMYVNSSNYLALDDESIPSNIQSIENTFLDFRTTKKINQSITKEVSELPVKGIDHPFLLDDVNIDVMQVKLVEETSKRVLEVYTTYPCIVIYSHNFPDYKLLENNTPQIIHQGICFETQFEPNGINIPGANNSILRKGETYYHKTIYQFSIGR